MSGIVTFKCPSCGAYLQFDPASQSFTCPYCESSFTREQVNAMSVGAAMPAAYDGRLRSYHCQACGSQLVTEETTAATRCYYCHNPVVLSDRISGDFHPDGVVPFTVTREQAIEAFNTFIGKKKFADRHMFTNETLENLTGVYYPYWLGDVAGEATFQGTGTRESTHTTSRETIITTRYFEVYRHARMVFRNVVRKGLSSMDRQLSDGIHPYDLNAVKPFDVSYLSGFLAERRDTEEQPVRADILKEVNGYVPGMMEKRGTLNTLRGASVFSVNGMSMRYLLLPCWTLTFRGSKPDTVYYFMMNGQNGKVCGRLPIRKSRLAWAAVLAGGAAAALLLLGGMFLW